MFRIIFDKWTRLDASSPSSSNLCILIYNTTFNGDSKRRDVQP